MEKDKNFWLLMIVLVLIIITFWFGGRVLEYSEKVRHKIEKNSEVLKDIQNRQ